jgi:type VI secretion system ImpA family protein
MTDGHFNDILRPISKDHPAGTDIRHTQVFDDLKELRREEDKTLSYDVWIRPLKAASWDELQQKAQQVLGQQAKDLQVLVWFTECFKKDFDGVYQGIFLASQFLQIFFDSFYPIDSEARVSILEWLARIYTERILTIPFGHHEKLTLDQWRYALFIKDPQLIEFLRNQLQGTAIDEINQVKTLIESCIGEVKSLKSFLWKHLPDAPTFQELLESLDEINGILDYRITLPQKEEQSLDVKEKMALKRVDVIARLGEIYGILEGYEPQVAQLVKQAISALEKEDEAL